MRHRYQPVNATERVAHFGIIADYNLVFRQDIRLVINAN